MATSRLAMIAGVSLSVLIACGCAQTTGVPQMADTLQDAATAGGEVHISFNNGPDSGGARPFAEPGVALDDALAKAKAADGQDTQAGSAGYLMTGRDLYVTVNIGSTNPGLTSTATGTQTVNPNQQPEASIAAPVGVAPGGLVDQGATAGLGSGTVSSEKQSEIDQQLATLKAATSTLEKYLPFLDAFMGQEATGTPETQPVEE